MAIQKWECPNCGGQLIVTSDKTIAVCASCESKFTIEDNVVKHRVEGTITIEGLTSKTQMHRRAELLMEEKKYADAMRVYREIIDKYDATDSDAWWGLTRASADDFLKLDSLITRDKLGKNYQKAVEYATPQKRQAYESAIDAHEKRYRDMVAKYNAEKKLKEDAEAQKRAREEEARAKKAAAANAARAARGKKLAVALAAILVLAACAAFAYFRAVVPGQKFNSAEASMRAGDYAGALRAFEALGGYGKSEARAATCRGMLSLKKGDLEAALSAIDALDGQDKASMQSEFTRALVSWEENGIPPETVLRVLLRADQLNAGDPLDTDALFLRAQVALAGENARGGWMTGDFTGSGARELWVLDKDLVPRVYEMLSTGSREIALDAAGRARCLAGFGDAQMENAPEEAAKLYAAARRAKDSEALCEKLSRAYARASSLAQDADAARAYAKLAYQALATDENYAFYYQAEVFFAESAPDFALRAARWDDFRAADEAEIRLRGLTEDALARAARLRLERAENLALNRDEACADALLEAEALGEDIALPLLQAAERFDMGDFRVRLRAMALERAPEATGARDKALSLLRADLAALLPARKANAISAARAIELVNLAGALGGVDADVNAAYREAALEIAAERGEIAAYAFTGLRAAENRDLIALMSSGQVCVYRYDGALSLLQTLDAADVPAPALLVREGEQGLISCLAYNLQAGAFHLYAAADGALKEALSARDAFDIRCEGDSFTYGLRLPGSAERLARLSANLARPLDAPENLGIDWHELNYARPQSAEALAARYLEALGYEIAKEAALLLSPAREKAGAYSMEALAALPKPDMPLNADIQAYFTDETGETVCLRALYASGGQTQTAYLRADCTGGAWALSGAANALENFDEIPAERALLCVNRALQIPAMKRGSEVWLAVYLPEDARVRACFAPAGAAGRAQSHTLSVYARGEDDARISYAFTRAGEQIAQPLYLRAGTYALCLRANANADACALTVRAAFPGAIELEPNDTFGAATPLILNQPAQASLQVDKDADFYAFTLEKAGYVAISLLGDESAAQLQAALYLSANEKSRLYAAGAQLGEKEVFGERVHLKPGTYYVSISQGSKWSGAPYAITVKYEESETGEAEYNNEIASARAITKTQAFEGTFSYKGDIDCFRVKLAAPGLVTLTAEGLRKAQAFSLSLTDASGEEKLAAGTLDGQTAAKYMAYLPEGKYNLTLTGTQLAAKAFTEAPLADYRLRVQLDAPANAEAEPNDTLARANALPLNTDISGNLRTAKDVDIYKLTLAEPGRLTLRVRAEAGAEKGARYEICLADAEGNPLHAGGMKQNQAEYAAQGVYLGAGTYYAQIKTDRAFDAGIYQISVLFEGGLIAEAEPNGSINLASALPLNETASGSLSIKGDADWFAFALPSPGAVKVELTGGGEAPRLTLASDTGENGLWQGKGASAQSPEIMLPAGRYALLVDGEATGEPYALRANFRALDAIEIEPNDTPAQAQPLARGESINASLITSADVDCFAVSVEEDAVRTFTLTPASAKGTYAISLVKDGKTLWSGEANCEGGAWAAPFQMPAGAYALCVKAKVWTGEGYCLGVQ